MTNSSPIQRFFNSKIVTVLLGIISVIGILTLQANQLKEFDETINENDYYKQEELAKVNLDLLRNLPNLGFSNLMADWVMLRFIQYFGDDEAREVTGYSLSSDYLEAIINHDPRFVKAYLIISPASSLYAGTANRTVDLMGKGLETLSPEISDSYFVWLYKGIDELLFLGDVESSKKSHEMAANWAKLSDGLQSDKIAKSARDTARFLSKNPNSKQAQVNAWGLVLMNASDDQTRQLAIRRIQELGGKVEITSQATSQGKMTSVTVIPPKED